MGDALEFTTESLDKKAEKDIEEEARKRDFEKSAQQMQKNIQEDRKKIMKDNEELKKRYIQENKNKEEIQKKKVIAWVNRVCDKFPWIAQQLPKVSTKTTLEEWMEIQVQVRELLNSQGSEGRIKMYFMQILSSFENYWGDGQRFKNIPPPLRLNIKGTTHMINSGIFNEKIDPLLTEWDIEYPWLGRSGLWRRTAETLKDVFLQVNSWNTNPKAKELFDLQNKRPIPTDLSDHGVA